MSAQLAFDRAIAQDEVSTRNYDAYGRLHVASAVLSKAVVNSYRGNEIPGWQALGLESDKIYGVFRDPDELAKAAPSFNNLPLLSRHVAVSAKDHKPDAVIGSTGSQATFDGIYLKNSLVVWAAHDIKKIEDDLKRELSCSYGYTPIMGSGVFEGQSYQIKMTALVGNHVAIVAEGRVEGAMISDSAHEDQWHRLELELRAISASSRKAKQ